MNNRMPVSSSARLSVLAGNSWSGAELKTSGDRKLNWRDWRVEGLSIYLSLSLINYLGLSQLAARDCHI